MHISTAQYYTSSAADLQRLQSQLNQTQEKISNNTKLLKYSDDPAESSKIAQLSQRAENLDQYKKNVQSAINQNNQVGSVLNSITPLLNRVKELGLQANNGVLSDTTKAQITTELSQLTDQLKSLLNTKSDNGQYLFSGFSSTQAPFVLQEGAYQYVGSQDQKNIQLDDQSWAVSVDSGYALFENITSSARTQSVLTTLDQLSKSIDSNASFEIGINLSHLDVVIDHLADASATVGARLQNLDDMIDFQDAAATSIQQWIAQLKDVDLTSAATQLNLQSLILQATQQSFAKISALGLFDFLK